MCTAAHRGWHYVCRRPHCHLDRMMKRRASDVDRFVDRVGG